MSKEKIAINHIENIKKKYLNDIIPEERKALMCGCREGNILSEIEKKFARKGIDAACIDITFGMEEDLTKSKNIKKIINDTLPTDILILGQSDMQLKWYENNTDKEIDHIIDTNLKSSMKIARAWINATIKNKNKKYIILIGSMAYNNVLNGSALYCISKAGIAMLAKTLAWELAPKNYNVIAIHPSNTEDAPMSEQTIKELMKFRNINRKDAEAYWSAVCPKGRFLRKKEIAELAYFFISGKCDFLSGANIELRGGQR